MSAVLTLRFTAWSCGHHGTRPADIAVESPELAVQICEAISHAISQPGDARAVVMDATHYIEVWISDDSVSIGVSSSADIPGRGHWNCRPVVIHGSPAEIEEIHSAGLQAAREDLYAPIEHLEPDARASVYAGETYTSAAPLAELEADAQPRDAWTEPRRRLNFEAPPRFLPAADVLAELRQLQAEYDAIDAENAEAGVSS